MLWSVMLQDVVPHLPSLQKGELFLPAPPKGVTWLGNSVITCLKRDQYCYMSIAVRLHSFTCALCNLCRALLSPPTWHSCVWCVCHSHSQESQPSLIAHPHPSPSLLTLLTPLSSHRPTLYFFHQ